MSEDILNLFYTKTIEWSKYPRVKELPTNKQRVLLILLVAKKEFEIDCLSAREIYNILNKKLLFSITIQSVHSALRPMIGKELDFIMKNDKRHYILKDDGFKQICDFLPKNEDNTTVVNVPDGSKYILEEIFSKSKNYIIKVVTQINGCFHYGFFDACAVMIRRLIETMIIEIYEIRKRIDDLKDKDTNNFYQLEKLITTITQDNNINLTRGTKTLLKNAKFFGDTGAHHRKAFVNKQNLDDIRNELGTSLQEFVSLIENP